MNTREMVPKSAKTNGRAVFPLEAGHLIDIEDGKAQSKPIDNIAGKEERIMIKNTNSEKQMPVLTFEYPLKVKFICLTSDLCFHSMLSMSENWRKAI